MIEMRVKTNLNGKSGWGIIRQIKTIYSRASRKIQRELSGNKEQMPKLII
jgi:hypothetical protein